MRFNATPAAQRAIPIGVSTGTFYAYPLGAALRLIARAGATQVELVTGPHVWVHRPASLRRMASAAGVTIDSLHPPIVGFPGWRDVSSVLPRMARLAVDLGVRLLCLHPPDVLPGDDALVLRFEQALDQADRCLRGSGVTMALENLATNRPRDARLLFHDPVRLLDLARRHGLSVVFDTCHADSNRLGLDGAFAVLRSAVSHVHLGDVAEPPRLLNHPVLYTFVRQHQMPGSGRLPLRRWLGELVASGYRGSVVLEISPNALAAHWPPEAERRLRCALQWTGEALAGLGQGA